MSFGIDEAIHYASKLVNVPQNFHEFLNLYCFLLLMPVVERFLFNRKQPLLRPGLFTDLLYNTTKLAAFPTLLLLGYSLSAALPASQALPTYHSLQNLNPVLAFFILMLLSELAFYWAHRAMHAIPALWECHRIHHSSTTFDSMIVARNHFLDAFLVAFPLTFIIAHTEPPMLAVLAYATYTSFIDRYGHSNIKSIDVLGRLGLVNVPNFHGWHHSTEPAALNKNFSRDCTFLDYLFGTAYFPKDRIPSNFGEPSFGNNLITHQLHPFRAWYRMLKRRLS